MAIEKQEYFYKNIKENDKFNIIFGNNGTGKTSLLHKIKEKEKEKALLIKSDNFRNDILKEENSSLISQLQTLIEKIINDKYVKNFKGETKNNLDEIIETANNFLTKNKKEIDKKMNQLNETFERFFNDGENSELVILKNDDLFQSKDSINEDDLNLNIFFYNLKLETNAKLKANDSLSSGNFKEEIIFSMIDILLKLTEIFEITNLSKYFILIDEIENSLHPKLIKKIIKTLIKLNDKELNIFITTHSGNIIKETLTQSLLLSKSNKRINKIKFYKTMMNFNKNKEKDFLYIKFSPKDVDDEEDDFLVNGLDLIFSEYIFIVEGKSDYLILNEILEKYYENKSYDTSVLFGETKTNFLANSLSNLKKIFGKEIFKYITFINIDDIDAIVKDNNLSKNYKKEFSEWINNNLSKKAKEEKIDNEINTDFQFYGKAFSNYIMKQFNNDENKIFAFIEKQWRKEDPSKKKAVINLNYLIGKKVELSNGEDKLKKARKQIKEIDNNESEIKAFFDIFLK